MLSIEELNKIRAKKKDLVAMRHHGEQAQKKGAYKYQVLVCGGTGCTSSGSKKIIETLEAEIKKNGLEKDVHIVRTGCFGLCSLGPIMIVYPEGSFYARVTTDEIPKIVEQHLKNGKVVKEMLYEQTVKPDGTVISLDETNFYRKQLRVALRNCGVIDPEDIEEYIATGGYQALAKVLTSDDAR